MRRYHQILAVAAVILFFPSIDLYLFLADYTTVTPRDWVTLFGALLLPLAIHRLYRREALGKRLGSMLLWSLAYMAVSILWYGLAPSDGAVQELRDRLLTVCFLGFSGFAFIMPSCRKAAGIAAIAVVLVTIVINVIQMIEPDLFVMYVTTRSSGLYGNANQCGAALVIGMIVGAPLLPRRLRLSFYLLVGAGVALTFSRSTIIGWLMASTIMLAFDSTRSRGRDFAIGTLAAAILGLVVLQSVASSGFLEGITLDDNRSDRASFFKTFDASDDAAQERRDVAAKALWMFAEHPFLGNGLGSTLQWSERSSTHNMFLYFMADHGMFGGLILPALLICVWLGRPKAAQGTYWAFCTFTVWYAFFSHNIFGERYYLLAFALFAMGGTVEADQKVRAGLGRVRAVGGWRGRAPYPATVEVQ